jgi:hypothetical protein
VGRGDSGYKEGGGNTMTLTKLHTDMIEGLDDLMPSEGSYLPLEGSTINQDITTSTLTGDLTIKGDLKVNGAVEEKVYDLTPIDATATPLQYELNPNNGTIQFHTFIGDSVYTANFEEGQSIILMIHASEQAVNPHLTWPAITWVSTSGDSAIPAMAPSIANTGFLAISLWKVAGVLHGSLSGDYNKYPLGGDT